MLKIIKIGLLVSVFAGAFSSVAMSETVDAAIQKAIEHHPSIMAARAGEGVALQDVAGEQSAYYPAVNASAAFGRIYADNTTTRGLTVSRGAGYSWYGEGTASLSQKIYDFNATTYGVNAATARYQSAGANRENQIASIGLQAAQTYLQLLRAQTLNGMARANQSKMEKYAKRIQSAFDNGGADESEVSRAQDFVSLSKNAVVQYQAEVKIAQASYNEIMGGVPVGDLIEPSINVSFVPVTLEDAIAHAVSSSPQIASAQLNTRATDFDLKREKTALYPELNAELSYNERDQKDIIGGESKDGRALLRLNWDYSLGGAGRAAKNRAAMVKQESEFNHDALTRTIQRDVEIAWVSLDLAKQKKQNESDRLDAAIQTLKTYKDQYEGGQRSILDLITVDNALFNAKQDYLNIRLQEMSAVYNLMNVMGVSFYKDNERAFKTANHEG